MSSKRQLAERKARTTNFQFHPKRNYEEPEPPREMTSDEMKTAERNLESTEKAVREASRCLFNLSLAVKEPSEEQIQLLRPRVVQLRDEVENMRSMFGS